MDEFNLNKMLEAIRKLPPMQADPFPNNMLRMGIPAYCTDRLPRTEICRYPGHPIVKWLAKVFRFEPDIIVERVIEKLESRMYMIGSSLYMHPGAYNAILASNVVA